jgi:hypothetical protein
MRRRELLASLASAPLAVLVAQDAVAAEPLEVARLLIVMDLIKDNEVTTPANYAADKIDRIDTETAEKYVDPFLRVWSKIPQQTIDAMTAEQKALSVMDRLKWFFRFAYVSEQADMTSAQQAAAEKAEATAETDLGSDEYSPE